MQTEDGAKGIALALGMVHGLHEQLWKLREQAAGEDEQDIDSAQVFLEGAHWKLNEVLQRHEPRLPGALQDLDEED